MKKTDVGWSNFKSAVFKKEVSLITLKKLFCEILKAKYQNHMSPIVKTSQNFILPFNWSGGITAQKYA